MGPGPEESLLLQGRGRVQMEAGGFSGQTTVEALGSDPGGKVKDKAGLWGRGPAELRKSENPSLQGETLQCEPQTWADCSNPSS